MSLFWLGIIIFAFGAIIRFACTTRGIGTDDKIDKIKIVLRYVGAIIAIIGLIINIIGMILN